MMPASLSKTDIATSMIRALTDRKSDPSAEELDLLDWLVTQMAQINDIAAKSFRGAYFELAGDFERARDWHLAAIEASPDTPSVYYNYAVTLSRFKRFEEATKISLQAVKLSGGSPNHVSCLLINAYRSENRNILEEWLPRFERKTGRAHVVADWLREDAEEEARMLHLFSSPPRHASGPLKSIWLRLGSFW